MFKFNSKFLPKIHIKIERWKYYLPLDCWVSTFGNIKNNNGELQTVCKKDGYLYYHGKRVHRIVMEAWKPIPGYERLTIDHLNHNTYQNDIWNLEYITEEENHARDKADLLANAPTDEPVNVEETFLLNKVAMSRGDVKRFLQNDKSLSPTSNVDKALNRAISVIGDVKFGNYTISYVRKR